MAMNLHELEEIEFRNGPVLWDADPDVCCAAYQLGACSHTEADAWEEAPDLEELTAEEHAALTDALARRDALRMAEDTCPF